jgi:hypothetical protein
MKGRENNQSHSCITRNKFDFRNFLYVNSLWSHGLGVFGTDKKLPAPVLLTDYE